MNKKLITLLWVYFGWIAVAIIFNKKTPSELKKEYELSKSSWKSSFNFFLDNFIEIHQNVLDNLKSKVMTESNKELFNTKKDEFLSLFEEYKSEWEKVLRELEVKWKDFVLESIKKLEKSYEEKLEELKDKAPEKFEELKEKLKDFFQDLRKKVN